MAQGDLDILELSPQELLRDYEGVNACGKSSLAGARWAIADIEHACTAPMVRYGKLPFRETVAQYDTHLVWTPMMLAAEFSRSAPARDSEFSTSKTERGVFALKERHCADPVAEWDDSPEPPRGVHTPPLAKRPRIRGRVIVQFAANDPRCPQKWAYQEGIGCALLRKPQLVHDLVRATKERLGWNFPVSVKIRVDDDRSRTNELVTSAIAAGADFISVHGRTRHQSSEGYPVDPDAIAFAASCAKGAVPIVANGDIFTREEGEELRRKTGVEGVMSARGLLANPALFSGYAQTPVEAVQRFVRSSVSYGLIFPLFHRHVSYMLESRFTQRKDRTYFNSLASYAGVLDWLDQEGLLDPPQVTAISNGVAGI
ncbi:hypothetical protein BMF94_4080 [Rhodotorula taiwanensis]|uniref:DUS-like FMN-binding domain-containing protein n=1 Tax=Rhodotorula taiwanensis TaxID=741276 RepID=A0A2S5B831_9BASI|nr:hypothetical protein BMF94_4080 [Rhodotorula taiwanensis]